METSKKAKFVRKMGKKRLKLTKREHFVGGGIAGLLGVGGGLGGSGYDVASGTNGKQLNDSYNANQGALAGQGALANTLAPQAQSAVNAQNTLSGQYGQQAQGAGPNVAQNVLSQATGANVANQAALMAGQRGAGANPALMARQAAMAGAGAQQQAAGQAATLQAQQQIAAEQAQAGLASNQIAQTQGATTANTQAQQGEQAILQNANTANNNITGGMAAQSQKANQGLLGGVMQAAGPAIMGLLNEGGEVHGKKLDFVHKMTKLGLEHHGKPQMYSDGSTETVESKVRGGLTPWLGAPKAAAADPPPTAPTTPPSTTSPGATVLHRQFDANGGAVQGFDEGGAAESHPVADWVRSKLGTTQSDIGSKGMGQGGNEDLSRYNSKAQGGVINGYADGGLTVPPVNYQSAQNPFQQQQMIQGGYQDSGPNDFMKFDKKKEKKPVPMGTTSAPTDPNITGANNPLVESGQASIFAPMAGGPADQGGAPGVIARDKAAHGGEMHPHFQGPHKSHIANYLMKSGGPVPAMVSAGEAYLTPEQVHSVIHDDVDPAEIGHIFKGKAKVKGDSKKNDTIPATLEDGGVVVDREHMGSPEKRKLFVHRAIARRKAGTR